MESTVSNERVRVNFSLTSKGKVQWECTCEFNSPDKTLEQMDITVDKIRNLLKKKGLQEAGDVA
ncbi:MAG: hypothetical protein IKQ23_10990 [Treponema sp.]|jgi:hypothetical protein|nr:hypothetical protein [Treponema sp.]MBR7080978.1 hypothetical protein [Treponema sp.]